MSYLILGILVSFGRLKNISFLLFKKKCIRKSRDERKQLISDIKKKNSYQGIEEDGRGKFLKINFLKI